MIVPEVVVGVTYLCGLRPLSLLLAVLETVGHSHRGGPSLFFLISCFQPLVLEVKFHISTFHVHLYQPTSDIGKSVI